QEAWERTQLEDLLTRGARAGEAERAEVARRAREQHAANASCRFAWASGGACALHVPPGGSWHTRGRRRVARRRPGSVARGGLPRPVRGGRRYQLGRAA